MKVAELNRFAYSDSGTFGHLITPDGLRYATVERPWLDNKPSISCIPTGVYICQPRRFNKGGYDAIEVTEVDGRTNILMHIANRPEQVEGCIGINTTHGAYGHQWVGLNSRDAFTALMSELGRETFKLSINNSGCCKG